MRGAGRPPRKRQGGGGGPTRQPPPFAERRSRAPTGVNHEKPDEQERADERAHQESGAVGARTHEAEKDQSANSRRQDRHRRHYRRPRRRPVRHLPPDRAAWWRRRRRRAGPALGRGRAVRRWARRPPRRRPTPERRFVTHKTRREEVRTLVADRCRAPPGDSRFGPHSDRHLRSCRWSSYGPKSTEYDCAIEFRIVSADTPVAPWLSIAGHTSTGPCAGASRGAVRCADQMTSNTPRRIAKSNSMR